MKTIKLSLILPGLALALGMASAAKAALVIHYSFNGNSAGALAGGTTIDNLVGADGTFTSGLAGGSGTIVASGVPGGFGGNALRLTPNADGDEVGNAPHILTGFTAAAAGITGSASYTAMAWVNFANATGDNMIFGSNDGGTDALHHGSRNGNEHSGHWGDDIGPDQGVFINTLPGTWHHVAYTNDSATFAQSLYFDGVLVSGPGAAGATGSMNINAPLAIGTSRNGGSFSGMLDEVRVYNTLLTQSEIQAAMNVVPEPATATLAGVLGLAGLMLRRRRPAH